MENKKKLFKIELKQPKSLRERIYIHLREAIANNYFPPGTRILEKEIARDFNVSVTPVREAIFQLSMEGFVEVKTHKNIVVKQVSLKEVSEIYEVQAVLEAFAGRLATHRLNDEHVQQMKKLVEKMRKYLRLNDVDKFYEVNEQMHEIYLNISENQLINDLIAKLNLRKKMFPYRVTFLSKKEVMKKAVKDHEKIIKGFLSGDPEKVEKPIRKHWLSDKRIKEFKIAMQDEMVNESL